MGGNYQVAFWISYLGLILAFWLGIYLVTRNPRYPIAWLTACALWSIAGSFLNILLAMDPPDYAYWPNWLQFFIPFWKSQIYTGDITSWLEGWTIVPAVAFWHHATLLLRPGRFSLFRKVRVGLGYAVAILSILVQAFLPILVWVNNSDPSYLHSRSLSPWHYLYGTAILVLVSLSIWNLILTARSIHLPLPRKQILVVLWATLVLGLAGGISLTGAAFQWDIPLLEIALATGLPIGIMGYGIIRYSALMEGRTIRRDFLYNLALLTLIILAYLLASWAFIQFYRIPTIILVVMPLLAAITHFLLNPAYRFLDWLFFRSTALRMRSRLRTLLRLAIEGKTLEDSLAETLIPMCKNVQATYGLIVTFYGQVVRRSASYHLHINPAQFCPEDFSTDDLFVPREGQLKPPLDQAALLIPLYADTEQLGALILGHPINGVQYAHEEVAQLVNLADQLSDAIYIAQLKSNYMHQIEQLTEVQRHSITEILPNVAIDSVEDALRNLYDYSYLADSPLAELNLVRARLSSGQSTHLERGKIVHEVLVNAIAKLSPQIVSPREVPPREWHPYLILWEAYQEEKSNRDIMAHLYISEGTFNRTRRAAIRAVSRAIGEMELACK